MMMEDGIFLIINSKIPKVVSCAKSIVKSELENLWKFIVNLHI